MPTGTVTITQGGSTAAGTDGFCFVFTGQNASPIGVSQSAANTTPSLTTGAGVTTGSLVVASNLGNAGTYTANGATTYKFDHQGQLLEYVTNGNLVVTATVSDTGLGLTWTERVKQNASGNGYAGIWTAPVPASVVSAGMLTGWEA